MGMTLTLAGGAQAQFGGFGNGGQPQPQPQPQPQGLIQSITPEQMAGLLGQAGFTSPQMGTSNDPKFKWMKMTASGVGVGTVLVAMFNCDGSGCPVYQIIMNFGKQNVDAKFLNTYNGNAILAKLLETQQGEIWLVSAGVVAGGVSPAQIVTSGKFFVSSVQLLTSNQ